MSLVNVEIVFSDGENIGIGIDWIKKEGPYETPNLRKYCETMLFLCYTLRQIRNLGDNFPGSNCLYSCIDEIKGIEEKTAKSMPIMFPHHCISHYARELKMDQEKNRKYDVPFVVTENIEVKGRRFIGRFDWKFINPEVMIPIFILETKGFGLGNLMLGKDIPQLALDSILAFYAYLLGRFKSEKGYFEDLPQILEQCLSNDIKAYLSGDKKQQIQEFIALGTLNPFYEKWE